MALLDFASKLSCGSCIFVANIKSDGVMVMRFPPTTHSVEVAAWNGAGGLWEFNQRARSVFS